MKIELTRTAQSHLEQLDAYIAEQSPSGAERVVDRIFDLIESLGQFPLLGHPGRVEGTRELAVPTTSYLIAYRVHRETIQVLAIIHGAQRWPARFNP